MTTSQSIRANALAVRQRLFSPPNAVPDDGIDLRRPKSNVLPFSPRDISANGAARRAWNLAARQSKPKPKPKPKKKPVITNNAPADHRRPDAPPVAKFGVREIQLAVCDVWGISELELIGNNRLHAIVTPRHVAFALCAKHTLHSYPTLGRSFRRDHTSILHGVRKMAHHIREVACVMPDDASALQWATAMRARVG